MHGESRGIRAGGLRFGLLLLGLLAPVQAEGLLESFDGGERPAASPVLEDTGSAPSEASEFPSLPALSHEGAPPVSNMVADPAQMAAGTSGARFTIAPSGESSRDPTFELWKKYKVLVKGNGKDLEVLRLIHAAVRQFPEGEVGPLLIDVTDQDLRFGILGRYYFDGRLGRMILFNRRIFHVVLHELAHHITIAKQRPRSYQILGAVMPGGDRRIQLRDVPSNYALTNETEFLAEYVTHIREMQLGLPDELGNRKAGFNPSPIPLNRTLPLYAPLSEPES